MRYTRAGIYVVLSPVIIVAAIWAIKAFSDFTIEKYKRSMQNITTVNSVSGFVDYGGRTYATLNLKDGHKISISTKSLDYSIYSKTDDIHLVAIDDVILFCRKNNSESYDKNGGYLGATVNIVSLKDPAIAKMNIDNIYKLTENIDGIDRWFGTFAFSSADARLVTMTELTGKRSDRWCYVEHIDNKPG